MRYALYWRPSSQCALYEYGRNWLAQTGHMYEIIQKHACELECHEFFNALFALQKYGFHNEFLPPFFLNKSLNEKNLFEICQKIAKEASHFDVKLFIKNRGHSLSLSSYYKNKPMLDIRQKMRQYLDPFIHIDTQTLYPLSDKFQIILSHSCDIKTHKALAYIAQLYWRDVIKNPLSIKHFYLCYQKSKKYKFEPIMKFDFLKLY